MREPCVRRTGCHFERPGLSDDALGLVDGEPRRRHAAGDQVGAARRQGGEENQNTERAKHKGDSITKRGWATKIACHTSPGRLRFVDRVRPSPIESEVPGVRGARGGIV